MNRMILMVWLTLLPNIALALPPDVPEESWFANTVQEFVDSGYIGKNALFRPSDNATRAEYIQMIVDINGGVTTMPEEENFDDVPKGNMFHAYFEEAGRQGWMKGAGNCYGSKPCFAYPNNPINRAEASALMIRAFGLTFSGNSPVFSDNKSGEWYEQLIKTAASLCILRGDSGSSRIRPADNMNRAEMAVMLQRAKQDLQYPNCEPINQNVSPSQKSPEQPNRQCAESDWDCESWTPCINGSQARTCEPPDNGCSGFHLVKPAITQTCFGNAAHEAVKAEAEAVIVKWSTFQDKLLERGEKYLDMMPAAEEGMISLDLIDSEFMKTYNSYVSLYESQKDGLISDNAEELRELEDEMIRLESIFNELPKLYY